LTFNHWPVIAVSSKPTSDFKILSCKKGKAVQLDLGRLVVLFKCFIVLEIMHGGLSPPGEA
jgi:hypothetical protein